MARRRWVNASSPRAAHRPSRRPHLRDRVGVSRAGGAPGYVTRRTDHAARFSAKSEIFQAITTRDIQLTADLFRPTFDRLDGRDGFVSLEVSPHLAHDTNGTIGEARRLWTAVDRPNAMIKVPATRAGLPAIQSLVSEGININVTLLFGLGRYQQVAEAFIAGLESRAAQGHSVRVASVASFFLSRIDVQIDRRLDELDRAGQIGSALAARLQGQIAIASARVAYQMYGDVFEGDRFRALAAKGARPQRLLWASTARRKFVPARNDRSLFCRKNFLIASASTVDLVGTRLEHPSDTVGAARVGGGGARHTIAAARGAAREDRAARREGHDDRGRRGSGWVHGEDGSQVARPVRGRPSPRLAA